MRFKRSDADIWTVFKTYEVFRTIDETIYDVEDICSGYDFELQLLGTPGTEGSVVELFHLNAVTQQDLEKAYKSGFRYKISPPENTTVVSRSSNELVIEWEQQSQCITGHKVTLLDKNDWTVKQEIVNDSQIATLADLLSCTIYKIKIESFLRVTNKTNEEYLSAPVFLSEATKLDLERDTALKSLRETVGMTAITISWSREEYPCLGELTVELCPADDEKESLFSMSCFNPSFEKLIYRRTVARFKNLLPCLQYKVMIFNPINLDYITAAYKSINSQSAFIALCVICNNLHIAN